MSKYPTSLFLCFAVCVLGAGAGCVDEPAAAIEAPEPGSGSAGGAAGTAGIQVAAGSGGNGAGSQSLVDCISVYRIEPDGMRPVIVELPLQAVSAET